MESIRQKESSYGRIVKVAGSMVVAEKMRGVKMNEIVEIGSDKIFGEIMRIVGDSAYIQCFQDPVGFSFGDLVLSTGQPLTAELGPGLLDQIFDGAQRPLMDIAKILQSTFLPKGRISPALNPKKSWQFNPNSIKQGDILSEGDIFGTVAENNLFQAHSILVPPNCKGRVTFIAPLGNYSIHEEVLELQLNGKLTKYSMSHKWPVRQPRPIEQRLSVNTPLVMGVRVIDALFPLALGGMCAIPGAFGCGKGGVINSLTKHSNTHVNIYVGCGERGTQMAEMLQEFPYMTVRKDDKSYSLMEKTCMVANTANMPVAVREASIYTGITIAEYFRDMGRDAIMIADSLSRWVEALKEISINMSEIPGPFGYPNYLRSRISQFYERAGRVRCLGRSERIGSITILGTVSPPNGDFSDLVASCVLETSQAFWALDKKVAQIKHFPSINWNVSTSNYYTQLDSFYNYEYGKQFAPSRKKIKDILREESEIYEVVKNMGSDYLSDSQKLIMEVGRIIRQQFLQQNAYSSYDYACPLQKTAGMMKAIARYYDMAQKMLSGGMKRKEWMNFVKLKSETRDLLSKLTHMKFQDPQVKKNQLIYFFRELEDQITFSFNKIWDR